MVGRIASHHTRHEARLVDSGNGLPQFAENEVTYWRHGKSATRRGVSHLLHVSAILLPGLLSTM